MVTRSSLVWVMTGIAAGIAGGLRWNLERPLDVAPSAASSNSSAPMRSPLTQRREQHATYVTPSDAVGRNRAAVDSAQSSSDSESSTQAQR